MEEGAGAVAMPSPLEYVCRPHIFFVAHDCVFRAFRNFSALTTGIGIHYLPSEIVASPSEPAPSTLEFGKRFPPQQVLRVADRNPIELHDMLPSDGRIKIILFAGPAVTSSDVQALHTIAESLEGVLANYPRDAFDIVTVLKAIGEELSYMDVPLALRSDWQR